MLLLKLQDQTFAFCRQFGAASIFSAGRSVCCYQAAFKTIKRPSYCLSRNARQCRLYCNWVAIHCNRSINSSALAFTRERTRRLIHGLAKQTHSCMNFIELWWQKGSFQTRKAFNFKIGLGSDPHLWPRILNIDWKNIISGTSSRDGSFGWSTRCDTSRQLPAVTFIKPWMQSHFSGSRDLSYLGSVRGGITMF